MIGSPFKRSKLPSAFKNLADIVEKPEMNLKTIGIIFDATKPYKTPKSMDYVTRLKVIDDSFHLGVNDQAKDKKDKKYYVNVFIYTNKLEDAPTLENIGDIIYLRKFDVYLLISFKFHHQIHL